MKVKVAQSCPTLCDPRDYTVHGILQAFPFSRASSQPRDRTQVSCFAGRFFAAVPPGKPRRDVDRPPLGCSPTAVTVWSTDGEGASWRVRAEQAAPVSTGNSVTCHTKGELGLLWGNGKDQVASAARQALGPHQALRGLSHLTYSQGTGAGRGCPWGVAQKGAQDIPLQFSLLLHVGLWQCYGQSAKSP